MGDNGTNPIKRISSNITQVLRSEAVVYELQPGEILEGQARSKHRVGDGCGSLVVADLGGGLKENQKVSTWCSLISCPPSSDGFSVLEKPASEFGRASGSRAKGSCIGSPLVLVESSFQPLVKNPLKNGRAPLPLLVSPDGGTSRLANARLGSVWMKLFRGCGAAPDESCGSFPSAHAGLTSVLVDGYVFKLGAVLGQVLRNFNINNLGREDPTVAANAFKLRASG